MTSILNQSKHLAAGLVLGSIIALPGYADSHSGNNYINFGIGVEDFDSRRQLKRESVISLGFEHRYNSKWATEISLMDSSPRPNAGGSSTDLMQLGIDALYYFDQTDPNSNMQPYGSFGLGLAKFDSGSSSNKETQARVGLGFRYLLGDRWSAKADAKLLYSDETHATDNVILVGLSYAFSSQKAKTAVVVMEKDSDADGVNDSQDQCPGTATGVLVDVRGCALDGDHDGIADHVDQCRNTEAGASVDAKGCKYVLKTSEKMMLQVNFANNSNNVAQDQYSEIEKVALFLRKYGEVSTVIEGHTDDRGAASYNQSLSQARANAVRHVLVEAYGIAANRITAQGLGESRPIEGNDTSAGREANRRVVAVMEAQVSE